MVAMRIATGQEVSEAIKHCGHSANLVEYCKARLEKQFAKAKLMKEPAIQQLLQQLSQLEAQFSKAEAIRENEVWFGKPPQSNDVIQKQIAQEITLKTLSEEGAERLKFRYALSEDGQFIRAFGVDGKAVKDAAWVQRLDDIVHSEFAKQHLSLDDDGRLRSYAEGKAKPATQDELRLVCQGLEKACQRQHIEFIAQQETYPSSQPVTSVKAAVSAPVEQTSPKEPIQPEAPSTGFGAQG